MTILKRLLQIILVGIVAFIVVAIVALYPKLRNMKSEYGTAGAIGDIETYIRENQGKWPDSPERLGNAYPIGGRVFVDYSTTSKQLIEAPENLQEAVRPRSGKFYTYPYYDHDLEELLRVLRETNYVEPSDNQTQYDARKRSR